ncbi:ABC transporter substrate binding protein [Petrocella sp. FN5]|uniref:ABC transporter substrate binding protein n=1 Tax=Petrocella sp. FN5 TaxID=3032002 RepID=UPI0023DAF19A|nr:ABC transporter substrate binding protein [Petrocella sp. FN5]MDF1616078.1 ABC transporter substrate binding protein [Petrocella sp. FN5]
MKNFLLVFVSLFLIYMASSFTSASEQSRSRNILIINAYHFTYEWTLEQNQGLIEILKDQYPNAIIYTEFLDWKRFPKTSLLDESRHFFENKYKDITIDLILTTDDMGLTFALDHRLELFHDAPIVFSGIIESTANEILGEATNVTGVYEVMRPEGTLNLISLLQPDVNKIHLIHDFSESGLRTADAFFDALDRFDSNAYEINNISHLSFDDLLLEVATFEEDSVIMMISYNSSVDGLMEIPEYFGRMISSTSAVPVYSIDEFLLGTGIIGGTFLSGRLQGHEMGKLAIQILEGRHADDLEHVKEATVFTAVDENQMNRFKLDKNALPKDIVILNEQFSFFETYSQLVLTIEIILGILILFIFFLMIGIRKYRLSEQKILSQKNDLQILNEQLSTSEQALKIQNDALLSYQLNLEHEAYHDPLTSLPNRNFLNQHFSQMVLSSDNQTQKTALVFINLDNFKYINNTYGHPFGDRVLKVIAVRLNDFKESTFTIRLNGDEFILLIPVAQDDTEAYLFQVMNSLKNLFIRPVHIDDENIRLTSSIGYSIFPDDGPDLDELLIQADMAMYHAKKTGKSTYRHYEPQMSDKMENDFILVSHLRKAYENKELSLNFQPQIDSKTHKIVGFEALLRWQSPELGIVSPLKIIPLAESSGLILPIGQCVLEQAIRFTLDMLDYMEEPFLVSVNISVIQLLEASFVEDLLETLASFDLEPSYLQLEITESILIESYEILLGKLKKLRAHGISLSLDDFGTGYSSLSYLQQLPLTELKIDKKFIDEITQPDTDYILIDSIIMLAQGLNLKVVAEGVEKEFQAGYLEAKGCHIIQGYYYGKPMTEKEIILYCHDFSVEKIITPMN